MSEITTDQLVEALMRMAQEAGVSTYGVRQFGKAMRRARRRKPALFLPPITIGKARRGPVPKGRKAKPHPAQGRLPL